MLIVLSYFATKIQNILYITKVFGKYYCRSVGTDPNFFIKVTFATTKRLASGKLFFCETHEVTFAYKLLYSHRAEDTAGQTLCVLFIFLFLLFFYEYNNVVWIC